MAEDKDFDFSGEGVRGKIRAQRSGRKLGVRRGSKKDNDTGAGGANFTRTRFVMDIEVFEEESNQTVTADFDPKLELRVRYNQGDVNAAGGNAANLALGFWDGSAWVRFTADKHGFKLESGSGGGGWGVVELSRFGDPPVAWGK